MEFKNLIVAVFATAFADMAFASECSSLPANLDLGSCCKFPALGSEDSIKKVSEQFKDAKLEPLMMECKVTEAMFKELKIIKDNAIDIEAMKNHIKAEIKEAHWLPVLTKAAEDCHKYMTDEKEKILTELEQSPFNIKKDQCNAIHMSMVTCIHLEGFENCPASVWTEEKKCAEAKEWIKKCGDDVASWKQLVTKKD